MTDYKRSSVEGLISKCIDIDSTFRDRKTYPYSSDFVIPFTISGRKGTLAESIDPVSEAMPFEIGVTSPITGTSSFIVLGTGAISNVDNFYISDYIELKISGTSQFRKVLGYTGTTVTAFVDPPFTGLLPEAGTTNLNFLIRKEKPYYQGLIGVGSTSSNIVLDSTANPKLYKGTFLRISSGVDNGIVSQILGYTGLSVIISPALANLPSPGDSFDILLFSYDNVQPMIYSGTESFSQPVVYDIKLLNLSIPFVILESGIGGAIDSYPKVYVTLEGAQTKNSSQTLYSNNPISKDALFVVPVDLAQYSPGARFATLYGSSIESVKFKPNEPLHFKVTLPNGELIKFQQKEEPAPAPVNQSLQISARFEITRR